MTKMLKCPKCKSTNLRCISAPMPVGIYNCLNCGNAFCKNPKIKEG